jgi:Protein of unknown function (DUF2934)
MSRTTTAPATQTSKPTPMAQPSSGQAGLPKDKVAMRAYQKWLQSGCKHGCDQQHWMEAEAELRTEMVKTGAAAPTTRR